MNWMSFTASWLFVFKLITIITMWTKIIFLDTQKWLFQCQPCYLQSACNGVTTCICRVLYNRWYKPEQDLWLAALCFWLNQKDLIMQSLCFFSLSSSLHLLSEAVTWEVKVRSDAESQGSKAWCKMVKKKKKSAFCREKARLVLQPRSIFNHVFLGRVYLGAVKNLFL